jgi:hypothetical protein
MRLQILYKTLTNSTEFTICACHIKDFIGEDSIADLWQDYYYMISGKGSRINPLPQKHSDKFLNPDVRKK